MTTDIPVSSRNREGDINELEANIKKQTEILLYKVRNVTNSVLIDCAVTEFLVSVIRETNQVTTFDYWLDLQDKKKGDLD